MPLGYRDSWLWQSAFQENANGVAADAQAYFKHHLDAMRDRAKQLVARILVDMPGYTVHDETHFDALWETASLVTSPDVPLNPAEAFVFGGAALLHDAGMTMAAYPGGLADIEQTTAWRDACALNGVAVGAEGVDAPLDPELKKKILTDVLRRLHAGKAAELATQGWPTGHDAERIYLIDDTELRHFYGPTVGRVAHSHWWHISRVAGELDRDLGPMPPVASDEVDVLKIACLLRVADALHLDRRRAPRFVRALERPGGISALHWSFQEKIAFPMRKEDSIVFTAAEPFRPEEADAWWTGYDALVLADRELSDADQLLRERGRQGLMARRVEGAISPHEMSRSVPVEGWRPVDTRVRVSDIPKIVENLGGEKLYGADWTVPVRELIQNAMDAVDARRRLQSRPDDWGTVRVWLDNRTDGRWLCVEDNGVGMSELVLTGALLDFGSSFWRSERVSEEFPGLAAEGMDAIGQFGIGFFSVFMLGDVVQVFTRRYDRGTADALLLQFRNGIASRPILMIPSERLSPVDGGTRVEVKVKSLAESKDGICLGESNGSRSSPLGGSIPDFVKLSDLVAWIAPASRITLETVDRGSKKSFVKASDWLTIRPTTLASRLLWHRSEGKQFASFVRKIKGSGKIYGRGAICPSTNFFGSPTGVLTSGGLRVQQLRHFLGVIESDSVLTAARDCGQYEIPSDVLASWAQEQAELLSASNISDDQKAFCAELILECGASILDLPIAQLNGKWLTAEQLKRVAKKRDEVVSYLGEVDYEEDYDPLPRWQFVQEMELSDDVLFLPELHGRFGSIARRSAAFFERSRSEVQDLVSSILAEAGLSHQFSDERVVAYATGEEIERLVEVFER